MVTAGGGASSAPPATSISLSSWMVPSLRHQCRRLVEDLTRSPHGRLFQDAVGEHKVGRYADRSSNPIHLSHILRRLRSTKHGYHKLLEFVRDVRLVWSNCGRSAPWKQACWCSNYFEARLKLLKRSPLLRPAKQRVKTGNRIVQVKRRKANVESVTSSRQLRRVQRVEEELRERQVGSQSGPSAKYRNLTMLQAAYAALRASAADSLTLPEIYRLALRRQWLKPSSGKTPLNSLSASMTEEVAKHGRDAIFYRVAPGVYSLRNRFFDTVVRDAQLPHLVSSIFSSSSSSSSVSVAFEPRRKVKPTKAAAATTNTATLAVATPTSKPPVLAPQERAHGMAYFPNSCMKFIPKEKEIEWLHFKRSTVPNAGLGLFLNEGMSIEKETIFCEYRGQLTEVSTTASPEDENVFRPYAVQSHTRVSHSDSCQHDQSDQSRGGRRGGKTPKRQLSSSTAEISSGRAEDRPILVNGVDESSVLLSLAPIANDAGPVLGNTLYVDFIEVPNRVFLQASRDIQGGEEILVPYGASYWGLDRYPCWHTKEQYSQLPKLSQCCGCTSSMEPPPPPLPPSGSHVASLPEQSCTEVALNAPQTGDSHSGIEGSACALKPSCTASSSTDAIPTPADNASLSSVALAEAYYGEPCEGWCKSCGQCMPARVLQVHTFYCTLAQAAPTATSTEPADEGAVTATPTPVNASESEAQLKEGEATSPRRLKRKRLQARSTHHASVPSSTTDKHTTTASIAVKAE